MNSLYGIANIKVKIFNDDWNGIVNQVNDFCAKHDNNILDIQFQNGVSGGVKIMIVYRDRGEEVN